MMDEDLFELNKYDCEKSLSFFIKHFWNSVDPAEYIHNWHIDAICEHLEAVSSGQIKRLIINIPPRYQKSLSTCVFWPAWDWIKNPSRCWLFASYAASLSIRDSTKCRRLIESAKYQNMFGDIYQLTSDQNTKIKFENDKNGHRIATSTGGTATGDGGDVIICFPGETLINTENGTIPISEIVEKKLDVNVLTFNHEKNKIELNEILAYEKNDCRDLIDIEFNNKTITCTEDHPIYIKNKGYVQAKDIKAGDIVLSI